LNQAIKPYPKTDCNFKPRVTPKLLETHEIITSRTAKKILGQGSSFMINTAPFLFLFFLKKKHFHIFMKEITYIDDMDFKNSFEFAFGG
jgi:hypothetical protein